MKSILIPDDVYERAMELAGQGQVSVDRLVVSLVDQHVEWAKLRGRAARGSVDKLKQVLAKVKDLPAEVADQL